MLFERLSQRVRPASAKEPPRREFDALAWQAVIDLKAGETDGALK